MICDTDINYDGYRLTLMAKDQNYNAWILVMKVKEVDIINKEYSSYIRARNAAAKIMFKNFEFWERHFDCLFTDFVEGYEFIKKYYK